MQPTVAVKRGSPSRRIRLGSRSPSLRRHLRPVEAQDLPVGVGQARLARRPLAGLARPDPDEALDQHLRHGAAALVLRRLHDAAVEARHDRPARLGAGGEIGMLQRLVVALVADQRIVPPGQALGEARLVGDVGQHAPERQMQVEGLELVPRGQKIAPPPSSALHAQLVRPEDRELHLLLAPAQGQHPLVRVRRPAADRVAGHALALPETAHVEHLVRPEVQPVAQLLAVGAGQVAREARRQPQPVRPDGRRGLARLLGGVAHLDHPDIHLVGRALGEDRVHGVGDEDQPPSHRDLRPHRILPVGLDALRIIG